MHCNISRIYILRERERERETKYRRSNGKLIWQCSLVSFARHLVLDKVSFMLSSLTRTLEAPTVNDLGYTKRYVRCLQVLCPLQ